MACCEDISYDESKYWERKRVEHYMQSLYRKIGPKQMNHMGGAGYKFNVSETYVVELDGAHKIKYVHDKNGADPCQSILDEIRGIEHEILRIQCILDAHDDTAKMLKRTKTSLREIQPTYLDPAFLESIKSFSTECITNYKLVKTKIIDLTPTLHIKISELNQKMAELQKGYIVILL